MPMAMAVSLPRQTRRVEPLVLRVFCAGGSRGDASANLRSAYRRSRTPGNRDVSVGFRVVCELE